MLDLAGLMGTPGADDHGVITHSLVVLQNFKGHVWIPDGGGARWNGLSSSVRRFWSALEREHALLKGLGLPGAEGALWRQRHGQISPDGHFKKWFRFDIGLVSLT